MLVDNATRERGTDVCLLSSGRRPNDERIYYKIARSLRKQYARISIVAPGGADHRFEDDIVFVDIPPRTSRFNRWRTWKGLYREAKRENAAVYQCEELDSWLIGWLVARKTGSRLVFDAHEYNPAEITIGVPAVLRCAVSMIVKALDGFLARRTDVIFVANQIVRGYYLMFNRFAEVTVLHNAPVLGLFRESEPPVSKDFLLCHEGSLRFNRGLHRLVDLVERLQGTGPKAELLVVGDVFGAEKTWLETQVLERNLVDRIARTGWLPYVEVGSEVERCQIGLITMEATPSNMLCGLPNKLFNYMRYGLPVVAPNFPEIGRIVRETGCGLLYDPGDDEALFEATARLATDRELRRRLGGAGRDAVMKGLSWEAMEERLLEVYFERVLQSHRAPKNRESPE